MTETPPQQDEQTRPGVSAENLRNYERFRRSSSDRKIAGVAGGLGRHLNIDPTVLRVLFVVLALFGGAGLVLYGAMWLIVPEEGSEHSVVQTSPSTRNVLLIVAGVIAALMLLGDSWGGYGFPWPLAIVAVVVLVVLLNRDRPSSPSRGEAPHEPFYASESSGSTGYAAGTTSAPPAGPPGGGGWAPYQPQPAKADRGAKLFGPTLALIALALGVLGLFDTAADFQIDAAAYAALALTVVGVMLLVGSVAGRAGGLIFLGIVAVVALGITSVVDGNWHDERRIDAAPLTASGVRGAYDITAGQIRLDLTEVADLERLDGRTLALQAEAGEIVVIVPDDVDVEVEAGIRFGGEINIDGQAENGNGVELNRHLEGGDDVPQIYLDLDLLVGHIEVRQENAA